MDSPIIHSAYDPSGQYLCYVTVALDSSVLVYSRPKGLLRPGLTVYGMRIFCIWTTQNCKITCLKWVTLASSDAVTIILGMNNGEIWLPSVLANEATYKFTTANAYEIKDLDLMSEQLWCIDSNDTFYQHDLLQFKLLPHFKLTNVFN
ncbi:UTP5-like protein [Saccharomyces kudriavzevii IFO 1802]|uniref:UTP5-like protein n=1 Tax=Saccharomyces kudriavzevii (strain ATCC MYA-4449 / AS 2.2408 / CBS 8840 / NBRC 1802 / NCYC 2889) TaxID=226230 RepID=J6EQD9_SACK1|nr:UTP5-like protein [Saccharomyces kudriavzevii IFO 1802]